VPRTAIALLLAASGLVAAAQDVDSGAIRLGGSSPPPDTPPAQAPASSDASPFKEVRRGFDYQAFESRLETLWFQRKAFLADGRANDSRRQAELLRAFVVEEGVHRLESMAGALLAESGRYLEEGHYDRALETIALAEAFDPGRPQASVARASVYWKSRQGMFKAAGQLVDALKRSFLRAGSDLSLLNQWAIVIVVALLGCVGVFSLLMILRYQVPLRHEIEELLGRNGLGHWSPAAGWGAVFLPFLIWIGAGWAAIYWIVVSFRFMVRRERVMALVLLLATMIAGPAFRLGVALYGVTTDPVFRTTIGAAGRGYDPSRIVELRQLVDEHPDDPVYHFLLAGLYKGGRYFEEAFDEYRRALEIAPSMYQAHINSGNIFHATGQHAEAINHYRSAIEVRPTAVLAWYNMHLAQSESFRFKEAEQSLEQARRIDPERTTEVISASREAGDTARVLDAGIEIGSVWQAALEGRRLRGDISARSSEPLSSALLRQLVNPVSLVALVSLIACVVAGFLSRRESPARCCIRCGRAYCQRCKRGGQAQEYCSQCLHLFVIGDGLAPETKTRKLYEVDRYERWSRGSRRVVSLLLPGSGHLLRGRTALGCGLLVLWFAALVAWMPGVLVPLERLIGVDLRLDLLRAGAVPGFFRLNGTAVLAAMVAVFVWLAGNVWRWRRAGV
jgi:tetratricopeptide (TPR) repeat protein